MNLIAMGIAFGIIANNSLVSKTEIFTSLLTNHYASTKFCRSIAFSEFIRIGISFNSRAELFVAHKRQIFDIVRIQRSRFGS